MGAPFSTVTGGGVSTARGFRAAGISAGIKANGNPDLALLVADAPAQVAAVYTTNKVLAAPVIVSQEHLKRSGGTARAIVVNSGCANSCTGDTGLRDARAMAEQTARLVGCPVEQVLVASTGVIGVALPMDKVQSGIPAAFDALGADQGPAAARAIMTTDVAPKESAARISIGGREASIGGMCKGAGMIEPMMATMLGFVTTDASVPRPLLDRALREAVDQTFNAITVDGDSSTNDCVLLLASGASGVVVDEAGYGTFVDGLSVVCKELALAIVRGGEGATKLVTINVTGAATSTEARKAAKVIANSLLVKTAIHGGDPNWGRLMCAAGRAGVTFDASRAGVTIGSLVLFKDGQPHDERAPAAAEYLKGTELSIGVDLGAGTASSTVWTCDLSAEYVRINADMNQSVSMTLSTARPELVEDDRRASTRNLAVVCQSSPPRWGA
jgi:glutamate N-acetyltransferase/amino-acid N-acetyltransferase